MTWLAMTRAAGAAAILGLMAATGAARADGVPEPRPEPRVEQQEPTYRRDPEPAPPRYVRPQYTAVEQCLPGEVEAYQRRADYGSPAPRYTPQPRYEPGQGGYGRY